VSKSHLRTQLKYEKYLVQPAQTASKITSKWDSSTARVIVSCWPESFTWGGEGSQRFHSQCKSFTLLGEKVQVFEYVTHEFHNKWVQFAFSCQRKLNSDVAVNPDSCKFGMLFWHWGLQRDAATLPKPEWHHSTVAMATITAVLTCQ
jgi:hypothetical protein